MKPAGPPRLARVYAVPAGLAAATAAGLAAGLLGDGFWDVASAVALALPLVALLGAPALVRRRGLP